MYQPGLGYRFSPEEKTAFDQAVGAFHKAAEHGGTGVRQNAFTALIKAAQPAFSQGELRCAVRNWLKAGDESYRAEFNGR